MASSFRELQPAQVTTPVCAQYLKQFAATPRTHNTHPSILRQVLAFAALEGLREGYNPIDNIQTKRTPGRRRVVTDDEIESLKVAALQATRNGQALVQMIDLALITGQRISDVIAWQWDDVHEDGLRVAQAKTKERLLIAWTRPLRRVVEAGSARPSGRRQLAEGRPGRRQGLARHRSIKMTEHYVDGKSERRVKSGRRRWKSDRCGLVGQLLRTDGAKSLILACPEGLEPLYEVQTPVFREFPNETKHALGCAFWLRSSLNLRGSRGTETCG
jgi:integrase